MQISTNTIDLLYVSDESVETTGVVKRLTFEGVEVSRATVADGPDRVRTESVDCLLVCDSLDRDRALAFVREIRRDNPSLPIVAFTGEGGQSYVERLLDAGVTDVLRSSVGETPPALVRTRLETVLEAADNAVRQSLLTQLNESKKFEKILRQISESIDDVVWVNSLDQDGLTYVNEAYEEVWGRPREKLYESRDAVIEGIHPDDSERVRHAMERQLEDPENYDETYRVVRPDGETRWIRSRAFGVYQDDTLERIVGIARDVTERKHREQELATERDLIERIFETSPVGIVVHDVDAGGQIVRANDKAAEILGVPDGELEGESGSPETLTVRRMDGTELAPEEFPFSRIEATGEPVRDEKLTIEKPDGERSIISIDGVPLFENGELERVVVTFDDVTERVERETQLTEQRDELARLDHINRIIRGVDKALLGATSRREILQAVCDKLSESSRYPFAIALSIGTDGRLEPTAWADAAADLVDEIFPIEDVTREVSPGKRAAETGNTQVVDQPADHPGLRQWAEQWRRAGIESMAAIPISYGEQEYGVVAVYRTRGEGFTERERDVLTELGSTVGHAIAAVESREREKTLTSLYEATEDLLAASTVTEVSEVVVDTAADVLELPGIGVFLFDDDENLLQPVAATETLMDAYDESQVFGPGKQDSITWHTYVTGERKCFTDVRESDRLANPKTSARSALLLPLGDHGVFVTLSTDTRAFDDHKRRLVGLLAATTEAALDRVAGQADIQQREQQLERRTERLEQFERLFTFLQELNGLLRGADTREEIERAVCEQLTANECVLFAWIGRVPPDDDAIEPRAWDGLEDGYLDDVSLERSGTLPAARTVASGDVTAVSNVTDHLRTADWAREAVDRDYQSVIAIPLTYGNTTYGVLSVYADTPGTFSGVVGRAAEELGESIAYSINSVETRQGILAERVAELELRIDSPDTFLNAVAGVIDGTVSYREITPAGDDRAHVLFALDDPPIPDVLALESELVAVESLTHVERGGEDLFRATLAGKTVPATLFDAGSIPHDVTASASETRATVRLPHELDVRVFLGRIRERYPDTELLSRRDVERTADTREDVRVALDENLTDRQREVLVTAYESGFFQSPRETTGAELAELLDLSQPTVTHHLREAQRRLFASLLDDDA